MVRVVKVIAVSALSTMLLSGCVEAVAVTAGSLGKVALQERSLGQAIDDTTVWTQINHHYMQQDVNDLYKNVHIKVTEGRVLLTGSVDSPETRVEAVRLAWRPDGVKEVINEIEISAGEASIDSFANDAWITARVRSKMLLNEDVRSVNYSIDTVGRKVYLMGIAQNEEERDLVSSLASTVSGVERVVSHVRIKDSYLRD